MIFMAILCYTILCPICVLFLTYTSTFIIIIIIIIIIITCFSSSSNCSTPGECVISSGVSEYFTLLAGTDTAAAAVVDCDSLLVTVAL